MQGLRKIGMCIISQFIEFLLEANRVFSPESKNRVSCRLAAFDLPSNIYNA